MYGPIDFVLVSAPLGPALKSLGIRHAVFVNAGEIPSLLAQRGAKAGSTLVVSALAEDLRAGAAAGCKTAAALWELGDEPGETDRARFRSAWKKWPVELADVRLISPDSLREWLDSITKL
jgi:hypothetical protein